MFQYTTRMLHHPIAIICNACTSSCVCLLAMSLWLDIHSNYHFICSFITYRNLALGIGIQNFPEGLAVSLPLRAAGFSQMKSFWWALRQRLVYVIYVYIVIQFIVVLVVHFLIGIISLLDRNLNFLRPLWKIPYNPEIFTRVFALKAQLKMQQETDSRRMNTLPIKSQHYIR